MALTEFDDVEDVAISFQQSLVFSAQRTSTPYIIAAFADLHAHKRVSGSSPKAMIQMRCGHFARNGTIACEERKCWAESSKWTEDFLFHLVCSICGKNVTNPMSAYSVSSHHGWNNWLLQESKTDSIDTEWLSTHWPCMKMSYKRYVEKDRKSNRRSVIFSDTNDVREFV